MDLTDTIITKETEVWTKDGKSLGNAMHLYHRQEEINPQLQFYATYLEIFSFETGERHYLPTDYLSPSEGENGRLAVSLTLAQVEHKTWNRKPSFIASGKAVREDLPVAHT
jgi:hypothetical protein